MVGKGNFLVPSLVASDCFVPVFKNTVFIVCILNIDSDAAVNFVRAILYLFIRYLSSVVSEFSHLLLACTVIRGNKNDVEINALLGGKNIPPANHLKCKGCLLSHSCLGLAAIPSFMGWRVKGGCLGESFVMLPQI